MRKVLQMYFHLLEGQRVTGSDMKKIDLGSAEPLQGDSNAKTHMAVMDGFGFPMSSDVSGLGTKFWHKKKGSYGIISLSRKAGLGLVRLVVLGGKRTAAEPPPWWIWEVQTVLTPERGFEV